MQYRRLGATDLDVSLICLGTMTWGEQNTEAQAHAQLDRAIDLGVNFIDAAEVYPVPPKPETFGRTEAFIGTWLKKKPSRRDKVIIATKVTGASNSAPHVRDGKGTLDAKTMQAALEGSLKRLQTDYIDLYQTHSPDRHTNCFGRLDYVHDASRDGTSIADTLAALATFVAAGKIRHVGVSNETPWGISTHLAIAANDAGPRIQSIQNPYNLLNRAFEIGLAEMAIRDRCGLLAYSPLAMGALTGKYLNGARPAGARLTLYERFKRYSTKRAKRAIAAYVDLARKRGIDPGQMALAFAASQPFMTSIIIGATSVAQLEHDVACLDVKIDAELRAAIDALHAESPNPCP